MLILQIAIAIQLKLETMANLNGPTDSEPDTINLMGVLGWLSQMSKRVRFGKDNYSETLTALRNLIQERSDLNAKIEKLERQIVALQKARKRGPYEVEGQGQWDVPDSP